MVTYYNKKDLVSFANYVINELKKENLELNDYIGVSHADYENWLKEKKMTKLINEEILLSLIFMNGDISEDDFNKMYIGLIKKHEEYYDIQLCWNNPGLKILSIGVIGEENLIFVINYFNKKNNGSA